MLKLSTNSAKTCSRHRVSPSSAAINKLCSVLGTMSPADVGLKEESLEDDRGHGYFLDLTN
ncbi:unnamed protein product [Prunus armeniaca]|uniref:Uncharacterized protein n=1 Tax=Prunus armeniaca TaxID=36596 RepID=A0A6J5VU26_PRUAR|nr:unnamed protein product [Prunus armeniaca]